MDKKEKQAMYKVLLFGSPFIIALMMAFLMPLYMKYAYSRYEQSAVKYISESINVYQKSYKKEFEKFQTDKNQLISYTQGFEGVAVYLDIGQLPVSLKEDMQEIYLPILQNNSYKILIYINSKKYHKSAMWFVNSEGVAEKLWTGVYKP